MKKKNGFTLMETLLAMTLFLIVIVSSYGIFSMGIQIWKRVTGASHVQRQALFALERMGEDIRSFLPMPKPEEGIVINKKEHDFKFEGNAESFLLPSVMQVDGGAWQFGGTGYTWRKSSNELCRMSQNAFQLYQDREPSCRVVLSGVRKLEFQYWIQSPISKTFSWYDTWEPGESLPQAIRLNMEVAQKNKRESAALKFERTFWVPSGDQPMGADLGSTAVGT